MANRSLKITETGAIQMHACGFLFAFYSNYGAILYCLQDISILILLAQICKIFIPHLYLAPAHSVPRQHCVNMFDADKTRMMGLPYGEKI